jgi:hypothetical protein
MKVFSVILIAGATLLGGCATTPEPSTDLQKFNQRTLEVGRALARQASIKLAKIDKTKDLEWRASRLENTHVIVSTSSLVTQLERSDGIGQMTTELLSQAFSNEGFAVMDYRHNGKLHAEKDGEFALSRKKTAFSAKEARITVTATYSIGLDEVSFNYKVIESETGQLVAALTLTSPKPLLLN